MPFRADILIILLVPFEIGSRPGAVRAFSFVDHRDERDDPPLLNQPTEVLAGSISRVGGDPVRLDAEASLGPVEHGL